MLDAEIVFWDGSVYGLTSAFGIMYLNLLSLIYFEIVICSYFMRVSIRSITYLSSIFLFLFGLIDFLNIFPNS